MNVLPILLQNDRVVFDGILVATQLCQTISSVVESFHICLLAIVHLFSAIFYFVCVVFDSIFKPFQLSIDESTVGINDWVLVVELYGHVEVLDGELEFTHVTVAATSIMKVDWVLGVDVDGLSKVFDCILEFVEPVPHQASSIV